MFANPSLALHTATKDDLQELASLIHFEPFVYRHLEYRPPLDWVGFHPFPILKSQGSVIAALACPPDPPNIAWIRLFVASQSISLEKAWDVLWPEAHRQLSENEQLQFVSAIPAHGWFKTLLINSDFRFTHNILMLSWERKDLPKRYPRSSTTIRPMTLDDIQGVHEIDKDSFIPVWQNSQAYLQLAFRQANVATVAVMDEQVVGYQISTATSMGGHVARLAVSPKFQQIGIGYALLQDLLLQLKRKGAQKVTVNTQENNVASLSLYEKAGFKPTGEKLPVYQLSLFR